MSGRRGLPMNRQQRRAERKRGGAGPAPSPAAADLFAQSLRHHQYGQLNEAVAGYRRLLYLRPNDAETHNHLGLALADLGHAGEAAACHRRAIELRPDYAEAHNDLGAVLGEQGRPEEAAACFRRVIALRPDDAGAQYNLGKALKEQGQLDPAIACYRAAIALRPDYPDAHENLALALLARGDMPAGWEEYEWRWKTARGCRLRRNLAQPQWRGEAAEGRTLLIHAEQGFGDTLQFCRYAAMAAARGLRVILEVQRPLLRLLGNLAGVDRVIARGEALPEFDLHCPMLSLPLAFGTTLASIPAPGAYLHADAAQTAAWRARLIATGVQGPRIGLAWAGNAALPTDRRRSLAPARLAPLVALPGLHFVSLQKDGPAAPGAFRLTDFTQELGDFADTAALVANLDLVISVDTATAHLAAALGRPVWLLDRFDPDWRWLRGRRDSPWYPTLRLYRQPRPGDWDPVVAEVLRDLAAVA